MNGDASALCQAALERFRRGQVDEAIREMRLLAASGYAPAQVFAGWASELGRSGPVNIDEAKRWYAAAAESGDAVGQYYLGTLLVRQGDTAAGASWIKRAATQDYAPALYRLGRLHEGAVGVEDDPEESLRLMKRAAAIGHPFAQRWIAVRGIKGREGALGVLRGLMWFVSAPVLAVRLGWNEPDDPNILEG